MDWAGQMTHLFPSLSLCIHLSEVLATVPMLASSVDWLNQRQLLREGEIASPENLMRSRFGRLFRQSRRARILFSYPAVVATLTLQLCSSLVVLSFLAVGWSPLAPLIVLLCATVLCHLRIDALLDAGNTFPFLCLVPLTVAELIHTPRAMGIALVFLAAQAALAYATAGWLKLPEAGWFDGSYLLYVLSSGTAGHAGLWRWLSRHRRLAAAAGTGMIAVEIMLSFASLLPPWICLLIICSGLCLHASISRVMGLKNYLWAFAATYPATFFLSTRLYHPH